MLQCYDQVRPGRLPPVRRRLMEQSRSRTDWPYVPGATHGPGLGSGRPLVGRLGWDRDGTEVPVLPTDAGPAARWHEH